MPRPYKKLSISNPIFNNYSSTYLLEQIVKRNANYCCVHVNKLFIFKYAMMSVWFKITYLFYDQLQIFKLKIFFLLITFALK